VRFVGKVDPAAMPALLRDADIFVNASVVDNQPVSILEAFAAGLPVVSTPTGDIAAMVRHGETGLIVPPLDADGLAAAVLGLLRSPDRATRLARHAHGEIARYTWPSVRGQWASAYAAPAAAEQPAPVPAPEIR
jgi:glycosyltransferase involved in cell wall biosynthesis